MSDAADLSMAKRPKTVLAGPYGHPFHPIFVTIPIGAWVAALIFGIVSRISDDAAVFATGGRWLVAIGVLGAVVAAVFGLMDFLTIPQGTTARRVGFIHMGLNLTTTAVFAGVWVIWPSEASVGTVPLALTVLALAMLGVSGWLGGKMSYRYGIRVADEHTQAEGFQRRA